MRTFNNMNPPIRWGVIGSGGIARRRTLPEGILAAPNAKLIAVYDTHAAANAEAACQFGAQPASSLAALLESGIDAVYLASPPRFHCEQTLQCAAAGKHVLCEKPLGLSVAEAETMIAACRQQGVTLGTAFMMRFNTQHQAALRLIQEGQLGQPVFGRAQLSCWYPPLAGAWRQDPLASGGGSLMDMGGHCIDLLEMFLGPVRTVSCFLNRTVHSYAVEDSALVSLQFAGGALGAVDAFFCLPDEVSQNRLELYGSQGGILASGTIGQGAQGEMRFARKPAAAGYDAQQARSGGENLAVNPAPINTYRAEIEEFSQALMEQREPANHAQLGLQSQRVLAACYASATSGKHIQVQ